MNKEIRDKYYRCLRVWISGQSKNKKSPGATLVDSELVGEARKRTKPMVTQNTE